MSLSQRTQDTLFAELMVKAADMDCGVALMQSGFSAEQICDLTWEQILFDPNRLDFVQVCLFLPERAGAQHNYTRPCTPQCAAVLRKCHGNLMVAAKTAKAKREAERQPILGKKVTPGELSKYALAILKRAGVENDTIHTAKAKSPIESAARTLLRNTYRKNLVQKCGLHSDDGTFKFLCGLSLSGDVTSSNYISFTSPEAAERLYTILKVLQPITPIPPGEPIICSDGSIFYPIVPNTTAENAGAILNFLSQHEVGLEIYCAHGADVFIRHTSKPDNKLKASE